MGDAKQVQLKNIQIPGSAGLPILLDVFYCATGSPKPVVIFSHGFKGFKDWGHFNLVAKSFAENGLVFIKFNFSHNGTTPDDPLSFGNLQAFGENNYLIELDDLRLVLDWTENTPLLLNEADPEQIYLLGHSRGGGISVIKASEDSRVKKLATWASVSNFVNRNKKRTVDTWQRDGVVYTVNTRTGQQMPLYKQFYDSMMLHKERLNVLAAVKKLNIPYLIIHGKNDEAVPYKEAEALKRSASHAKLITIEDGTHTFGASHSYNAPALPEQAARVVSATIGFFNSKALL